MGADYAKAERSKAWRTEHNHVANPWRRRGRVPPRHGCQRLAGSAPHALGATMTKRSLLPSRISPLLLHEGFEFQICQTRRRRGARFSAAAPRSELQRARQPVPIALERPPPLRPVRAFVGVGGVVAVTVFGVGAVVVGVIAIANVEDEASPFNRRRGGNGRSDAVAFLRLHRLDNLEARSKE